MLKKNLKVTTPLLLSSILLASCTGSMEDLIPSEQVDYKSTVRGDPLSLPPDLSKQAIAQPKYTNNASVASANAYNDQVKAAEQARKNGNQVLPQNDDYQVMRNGTDRWLLVNKPPKQVYDELIGFWNEEGFTIKEDNPTAGIIQTDWAENRAKIPGNFLRRVVGSLVDVVSDSGERERFVSRLERNGNKTEVHFSHERMVETATDRDGVTFKWLPAKEDPGLNAVMLSRYMQYAGIEKQKAEQAVAKGTQEASTATSQSPTSQTIEVHGSQLVAHTDFEQSWTKVGQALRDAGFTIDDQDKQSGVYTVRYLDTDNGVKREEGNVFTRLINGRDGNIAPEIYRVRLNSQNGQTIITADNRQKTDQVSAQATANRILRVIAERF